ncbi:MAG: YitT family protein, partial [Lachnospiraceae bacterium]|nr:YitT family protein [Lachnospiraceae bacterium]
MKERAADLLADVGGSLAMAVGIFCFAEPADIAPGGISGISVMLKYLFGLPVGLMTFLMNIPLLVLAWNYMGRRLTLKSL